MPIHLVAQLNELIGRWDIVAAHSNLSKISSEYSPEQKAYYAGLALGMETARDELAEILATFLKDLVSTSGNAHIQLN